MGALIRRYRMPTANKLLNSYGHLEIFAEHALQIRRRQRPMTDGPAVERKGLVGYTARLGVVGKKALRQPS